MATIAWANPRWARTYGISVPRVTECAGSWAAIAYAAMMKLSEESRPKLFEWLTTDPDHLPGVLVWRRVSE